MVNRRSKRKSAVAATGGASETVQGRGVARKTMVGGGSSPFVLTGPTTVREQLTAMRGASNSGSSRFFSGQFNFSSKCNLVSSSVAQINRLNRCYYSRGAIHNCDMSAPDSRMPHKVNADPISVLPVPYSFLNNESHNQQQFNGASSRVIMKPAAVKPQAHPHKPQPIDNNPILIHKITFPSEECEADKEVALINSSNFNNMALATNAATVNIKQTSSKKKKTTRISPRVSKLPYRKTRQSPRFILSPADATCIRSTANENPGSSDILVKNPIMNEAIKVEPKRSCLDVLLERQKRLQKIVITLKRKPRPFTNLRRAIEKARRAKVVDLQDPCIEREELKCSTPKNLESSMTISSNGETFAHNSIDTAFFTETEKAVESIGQAVSPIAAPLSSLDAEDSFDDLIPEEFMVDESEILGISLDNISAFGDSYAELDFDEETRSSFPEFSDNTPVQSENSDNLASYNVSSELNRECVGNQNQLEPSALPFFQPQIGAIQPSQKLDKCIGSQIGAQPSSMVLSNSLNFPSPLPAPVTGVNILQSKAKPSSDDFHWPGSDCSPDSWKSDRVNTSSSPIRKNLLSSGSIQLSMNSVGKTVLTDTVSIDFDGYQESVVPRTLKESPFGSKSRSTPLRNLMTALSPIQSMSCSTASARIDSPLFLTASPSEELSPLS